MPRSPCTDLTLTEQAQLLTIARQALSSAPPPEIDSLPAALQARAAVFVTLTIGGELRGCIGTLQAEQALARAVAEAAHSAAFEDPRFGPLTDQEFSLTRIEVAVLSPLEDLPAASRDALSSALQPGVDGLLLTDGAHRATFLPSVWQQLPGAEEFLDRLFGKAGLGTDHWSDAIRFQRYRTHCFEE